MDAVFALIVLFFIVVAGGCMAATAIDEAHKGWKDYKSEKERLGRVD